MGVVPRTRPRHHKKCYFWCPHGLSFHYVQQHLWNLMRDVTFLFLTHNSTSLLHLRTTQESLHCETARTAWAKKDTKIGQPLKNLPHAWADPSPWPLGFHHHVPETFIHFVVASKLAFLILTSVSLLLPSWMPTIPLTYIQDLFISICFCWSNASIKKRLIPVSKSLHALTTA